MHIIQPPGIGGLPGDLVRSFILAEPGIAFQSSRVIPARITRRGSRAASVFPLGFGWQTVAVSAPVADPASEVLPVAGRYPSRLDSRLQNSTALYHVTSTAGSCLRSSVGVSICMISAYNPAVTGVTAIRKPATVTRCGGFRSLPPCHRCRGSPSRNCRLAGRSSPAAHRVPVLAWQPSGRLVKDRLGAACEEPRATNSAPQTNAQTPEPGQKNLAVRCPAPAPPRHNDARERLAVKPCSSLGHEPG